VYLFTVCDVYHDTLIVILNQVSYTWYVSKLVVSEPAISKLIDICKGR